MMKPPKETSLPLFSYGIFKPGQLGFFKIENFVENYDSCEFKASLYERDGVPILNPDESEHSIKGYLINFKKDHETEAYNKIGEMGLDHQYKWGVIQIDDKIRANVLAGKMINKGTVPYENNNWDGSQDPLFTEALDIIESKTKQDFSTSISRIFHLQMAYMLLWSSIERYGSIKYGLKLEPGEKNEKIYNETAFKNGLEKHVTETRILFNAIDPDEKITLNPTNPKKSMDYYYQVRCNSVHRGKSVHNDEIIIRNSLKELLAIFREMLDEAFKKPPLSGKK